MASVGRSAWRHVHAQNSRFPPDWLVGVQRSYRWHPLYLSWLLIALTTTFAVFRRAVRRNSLADRPLLIVEYAANGLSESENLFDISYCLVSFCSRAVRSAENNIRFDWNRNRRYLQAKSAGRPPVAVCNCWRSSLRHCWCSVVEQFASRHCCVWHTSSVPLRT